MRPTSGSSLCGAHGIVHFTHTANKSEWLTKKGLRFHIVLTQIENIMVTNYEQHHFWIGFFIYKTWKQNCRTTFCTFAAVRSALFPQKKNKKFKEKNNKRNGFLDSATVRLPSCAYRRDIGINLWLLWPDHIRLNDILNTIERRPFHMHRSILSNMIAILLVFYVRWTARTIYPAVFCLIPLNVKRNLVICISRTFIVSMAPPASSLNQNWNHISRGSVKKTASLPNRTT